MMRLLLSGLILLLLSGCFALNREQYESIQSLDSNYKVLEARDRELSQQLDHLQQHSGSSQSQEH